MTRPPLSPTERSTVRRGAARAHLERERLDAILDEALVCHVSMVLDGAPLVIPTGFGRDGDRLYLHGSSGAASMRAAAGMPVCVAVTLLDGIVYSRSAFHHSVNHRSAVIHGLAHPVVDAVEKNHALRVLTEHIAPGSWDAGRPPTAKELARTAVLAVDLYEASVKIRTGGPNDDPEDIEADRTWAGVLPMVTTWGRPVACARLSPGTPVPAYVTER